MRHAVANLHVGHSDGPWSACKEGDCKCGMIWDVSGNCLIAIAQGESEHLDRTGSGVGPDCVPTDQRQKSNARLIAAAPTMYEYIESSASAGCASAKEIIAKIKCAALSALERNDVEKT